jgi:hypothetical protein
VAMPRLPAIAEPPITVPIIFNGNFPAPAPHRAA